MYRICAALDHVKDDSTVTDQTKYNLYMFRTKLQVMVKNHGHAINDIRSALFYIDDDNGYLALIDAYVQLEAFDKALKIIDDRKKKLLELGEKQRFDIFLNKEIDVQMGKKDLLERLEKLEVFKNMENSQKLKLYDILTKRGIKVKPQIHNIPAHCQANIYEENGVFHFPILVIYEEFNVTDYIQDVEENILVSDILEMLLAERLPWDKENKYNLNTCVCFFEISDFDPVLKRETNYYYPMRNDDKLIDVLTNRKVYMNGFPVIVVLSQISKFYPHFMQNKIVLKRK
jgi:hypothetical protein